MRNVLLLLSFPEESREHLSPHTIFGTGAEDTKWKEEIRDTQIGLHPPAEEERKGRLQHERAKGRKQQHGGLKVSA